MSSPFNDLFPEYIFKYGPAGILAVWLFTVNNRLGDVEERLYRCLEQRAYSECVEDADGRSRPDRLLSNSEMYAILPDDILKTIKKEESNENDLL